MYNRSLREGRIISGDAFTHIITRGLGLPLERITHDEFPEHGEVGGILSHALLLYSTMLEASSPPSFFIQALALLEFLAYPDDYEKFEKVKRVVARYIAQNSNEYSTLLNRFYELTGKKEEGTERIIGYRTCLVHMGQRIEDVVPDLNQRRLLFTELDGYIRAVIDHMVKHSGMNFKDYLILRKDMRQYEN